MNDGGGSADGGGSNSTVTADSSEKGARHDAIVEREGKGGDGSALCRPPAPPALVDDADWCVCFEGLICEGSDCDVDM